VTTQGRRATISGNVIHAVEASQSPDRAVPSAERLTTLVPGAGHLVRMPAHTYWVRPTFGELQWTLQFVRLCNPSKWDAPTPTGV
jgi:hypothetical protein